MSIPEPVREAISISQLEGMGISHELAPAKDGKALQSLSFEVPDSFKGVGFSFSKVRLYQGDSLITSYEMSRGNINNKEYASIELNTNVVTSIVVEFWFSLKHVYEVSLDTSAL